MNRTLLAVATTAALGAAALAQAPPQKSAAKKLPSELVAAQQRAAVHNKRVLVALPTEGQDLAKMIKRDRSVSRTFLYEFEVVQLAADFEREVPRPALLVQDARGATLAQISAATFLADGALKGAELLAAVKLHFCAPLDASKKLAAAKAEAKKSGRNILIRFDAPW